MVVMLESYRIKISSAFRRARTRHVPPYCNADTVHLQAPADSRLLHVRPINTATRTSCSSPFVNSLHCSKRS
jgi:hypothetical protein